jgi:hypothetical protein
MRQSQAVLAVCLLISSAVNIAAESDVTEPVEVSSPESTVATRAAERWAALVQEDYEAAYAMLSPGYRAKVPPKAYRARFEGRTDWKDAEVREVSCEGETCTVKAYATYRFLGTAKFPPMDGEYGGEETWVRLDGQWWHVPKK